MSDTDTGSKHEQDTIVIFGASGDLTQRMLIPALFNLYIKQRLPEGLRIVGFASDPLRQEEFCSRLNEGTKNYIGTSFKSDEWNSFEKMLHYIHGDFTKQEDYKALKQELLKLEGGPANRLYYLATSPTFFGTIAQHLGETGMASEEEGWRRIIVEKPFGRDLQSAEALNKELHKVFNEKQIYRIDHYLGKETAQNIMFFRFANTIFEPIWNRNYIDNVQITVAEEVDVGHRAGYYDKAGVIRDMFQNHMLQLLSLITMEPPASFSADVVRNEKVEVLMAVRPFTPERIATDTLRAQYADYINAPDVAPDSQTPTFAVLKMYIDNWRWQGVPFYLRSGKALKGKTTEMAVTFKCPPHLMFNVKAGEELTSNIISFCIQPDEGIHLRFETKVPDSTQDMRSVDMDFLYRSSFSNWIESNAYERLLLDALNGDASLFTRSDEIETAWKIIDPILQAWAGPDAPPLLKYDRSTWGPPEADSLINRDGREWRLDCGSKSEGVSTTT